MEWILTRNAMRISVFLLALLLAGCGLARLNRVTEADTTTIREISDHDICWTAQHWPSHINSTMQAEMSRRGLGDCSEGHLICHKHGLEDGTPDYAKCRSQYDIIATVMERNQAIAEQQLWNQSVAMQPQYPRPQSCTSNVAGKSIFTNCQ